MNALLVDPNLDFTPIAAPAIARAADGYAGRPHFPTLGRGLSGTCLVSAAESKGAVSLFHVVVAAGAGVPPHIHQREDEVFLILEGRFEIQIGDQLLVGEAGGAGFAPRGVPHAFRCVSEAGGRMLTTSLPGGFEAFLADLNAFGPLPEQPVEGDLLALFALMARHGVSPVAPGSGSIAGTMPEFVGPVFELGDHRGQPKLVAEQTGGSLLVVDNRADFGGGVPPHIHHREDEIFFVTEGRFRFTVGDQEVYAGPGDCVFGPREVVHSWWCVSPDGGRMLIYFTPGDNFQAFGQAMAGLRAVPSEPSDPAAFLSLAERHGITMLAKEIK